MATNFLKLVYLSLSGLAVSMCSCQAGHSEEKNGSDSKSELASAEIKLVMDDKGKIRNEVKHVKDAKQLAKLAAFFPGMGKGKKSREAGSWKSRVIVTFEKKTGEKLKVTSNFDSWTEGKGDWDVEGDLKGFITKLFPPANSK